MEINDIHVGQHVLADFKGDRLPATVEHIDDQYVRVVIDHGAQSIPAIMYPNRLHHNNIQE